MPRFVDEFLSVAGVWSGFDTADVERRIVTYRLGRMGRWFSYHAGGTFARHDWAKVRAILAEPRAA